MSNLSSIGTIANQSQATTGLWNRIFSRISNDLDALNTDAISGVTLAGTANQISIATNAVAASHATLSLPSTLRVPGTLTVPSEASFLSNFTISSGLSVGGMFTSQLSAQIAGSANIGSGLTVGGLARFSSDVSMDSAFTAAGTGRVDSTFSSGGTLKAGTDIWAQSDLSYGRTLYSSLPIQALAANKFFAFSDYNMGFRRSVNSATLRFTGPVGSDASFYCETPFRFLNGTGDSSLTIATQYFSGTGGEVGGYNFTYQGTGMQQGSLGAINFLTNASPGVQFLGVTSNASVFLGLSALGGSNQRVQLNGSLSVVTTGTSVTSSTLSPTGLVFFIGGVSGASIAINSGGTIYWFDSSGSTKG